jgi:GT2 family glycosyltransferase
MTLERTEERGFKLSDIIPGLVSTIIPVYNRPRMLREAIESVLAQTYRPIEVIIVDDGSKDDTPQVGEALESAYPNVVRLIQQGNRGPGLAREAARCLVRGEYVQYLDSDDLLRPDKFAVQVAALQAHPECGAAYGYICFHPWNGPAWDRPFKKSGETRSTLFPWVMIERWWNTDAPLYRRSVYDAVGPWCDLASGEDWEYDARVGSLGTKLVHCPQFVCDQRRHESGQITGNINPIAVDELRNKTRLLDLLLTQADRAGVAVDAPERQHFVRWAFLEARRCAAVGLPDECRTCLEIARRAARGQSKPQKGIGMFQSLTRVLGMRTAGRAALILEKLRRQPGQFTINESPG